MNCLGNSFVMLRCCKFIEKYLDDILGLRKLSNYTLFGPTCSRKKWHLLGSIYELQYRKALTVLLNLLDKHHGRLYDSRHTKIPQLWAEMKNRYMIEQYQQQWKKDCQ